MVAFDWDGKRFEIPINQIHLEKDAGKLIHRDGSFAHLNQAIIGILDFNVTSTKLAGLLERIESGEISRLLAKEIFSEMASSGKSSDEVIVSQSLEPISETSELESIIDSILGQENDKVNQYKYGKIKLFDYFMGLVMKKTGGRATRKK